MAYSSEQIRNMAIKEVEIVGFEDSDPIIVKLKTLSLLGLVSNGKIPNNLLGTAMELFEGKSSNKKNETDVKQMSEMSQIMNIICANSLVEPAYDEIEDVLTDEQKMEIFYYTQGGVKSLQSFRAQQGNTVATDNITSIQG